MITTSGQHFPNKPEIISKAFSNLGQTSGYVSVNLYSYSGHTPLQGFADTCPVTLLPGSFSVSSGCHINLLIV